VVLGDLIIAVDGQPVRTNDDLLLLLETHKPGDRLRVTLEREGRKREATVELGRAL
jgi:putative serine protease PepD